LKTRKNLLTNCVEIQLEITMNENDLSKNKSYTIKISSNMPMFSNQCVIQFL